MKKVIGPAFKNPGDRSWKIPNDPRIMQNTRIHKFSPLKGQKIEKAEA